VIEKLISGEMSAMTVVKHVNSDIKRTEEITLSLVGDIFPANLPMNIGLGVAARFSQEPVSRWKERLTPLFADSNIVFGNLEAPLIRNGDQAVSGTFAGDDRFAGVLASSGVDIVSIANNHILEQGADGFESTLRILNDAQIDAAGLCEGGGSNIVVKEVKGLTVGFASFCAINNIPNAELYAEYTENKVLDCIQKMRSIGINCKVIAIHWGDEFCRRPSPDQIVSARKFIDAGADIIAGHHPHVIQPVEEYKRGLILYSLGNFIFDMVWSRHVRDGLLATVKLSKQGVSGYELRLIRIDKNDFFPAVVSDQRALKGVVGFQVADLEQYGRMYKSRKKWEMIYHRVLMKKTLIANWSRLPSDTRRDLVKKFRFRK
jgi:poly-gamma-glutamate synthesis protein (capsule biosynthesis protein)